MISRRSFLKGSILTAASAGAGVSLFHSFEDTTSNFELVRVKVPIEGLKPEFEGYRIGFMTDFHFGSHFPHAWIEKALALLQGTHIDLLLLGGDYIWISESLRARVFERVRNPEFNNTPVADLPRHIYSDLADLIQVMKPPDGIFAVYGNHDRWTAPQACAEEFSNRNIQMLINDTAFIKRGQATLEVFGTDDYWTGIPKLQNLRKDHSQPNSRIVLSHNPDLLSYISRQTELRMDLGLAGHTHGGQIRLPILGAIKDNILDNRLLEGLTELGRCLAYTSKGVGVVEVPYRFNCRPEVSLIELVRV